VLRPSELAARSRGDLLILAARLVLRVEPWRPEEAAACWEEELAAVIAAAGGAAIADAAGRERALLDLGARACNRLERVDAPRGRAADHALCALAAAVAATAAPPPALRRAIIDCAKQSASIPALLAHAGRIRARGGDAVDVACAAVWNAIRADVARVAGAGETLRDLPAVRAAWPLWPGRTPAWAR
jgi:hypothetical protein